MKGSKQFIRLREDDWEFVGDRAGGDKAGGDRAGAGNNTVGATRAQHCL